MSFQEFAKDHYGNEIVNSENFKDSKDSELIKTKIFDFSEARKMEEALNNNLNKGYEIVSTNTYNAKTGQRRFAATLVKYPKIRIKLC